MNIITVRFFEGGLEMQNFVKIAPEELGNVFSLVGKDWMLITAGDEQGINTMTASWGGIGVLWNKPVAFCFIRPQRHTLSFVEANERLSLSFFGEEWRDALRYCGTKSGRDTDKFAATGLTPCFESDVPYIAEARLVLLCRKLYVDDLKESAFLDRSLLANYKDGDFHRTFIVEIEGAYLRR